MAANISSAISKNGPDDNADTAKKNDESVTDININIKWSVEHERILIEWADKAMCYRWLHSKANAMYYSLNTWYTIPVIIISTLTGTANFAQTRVPENYQNYYVMGVGGFNILAAIISTIQQFLKITQLNEAHRVSSIAWDKFYRNVKIELAKHPSERTQVLVMLKTCKEEFDRLMETSPVIPDKIIQSFKDAFKNAEDFTMIVKPEICDVLISTDKYRNPWFSEDNQNKEMVELLNAKVLKETKHQQIIELNKSLVIDFKRSFFDYNHRQAMDSEIIDNLKDKMDMDVLLSLIETYRNDQIDDNGLYDMV
jgi:hypothetical protein